MDRLIHLLKLTQKQLKIEVYSYLQQKKMKPIYEDGFVYAEGDIPILLVAHMDTVFDEPPKKIFYNNKQDKIFNPDGGLGGDDRCGVYAILRLLEKYRPYVLFTEDEEIGCVGALKAIDKLSKPKIKYIIEFDRRGNNDCVFYECGNEDFMNYVESFGFKTILGTCSDISVLGSEWNIAAVNLSSGYYREHTKKEYAIFGQLQNNINRAAIMLKAHKNVPYFDYQEIYYAPSYFTPLFEDWTDEELLCWTERYSDNGNNYSQPLSSQEQFSSKKMILKMEEKTKDKKGNEK